MRRLSLGFALLFLLQLGVSAPQSSVDPKQSPSTSKQSPSTSKQSPLTLKQSPSTSKQSPSTSKGSKTKKSLSSMATPQALGDEIAKYFGHKTGKELMMEKAGKTAGTGTAAKQAPTGKPPVRGVNAAPLKPGYVPPPPTPRASVSQVRQEIQKIFDLNKKIKNVQSGRSAQLQRVQEQARIHQKILNELEASQKQASGQKASAKNALLAQEKLRIIHEETQRNTQVMNDLKDMSAKTASKTVEKVKTVAS